MGTNWSLAGYVGTGLRIDQEALREEILARFQFWNDLFSTWEAGSFITRFNRSRKGEQFVAPPVFADMMARAVRIADASGGAFNPCLGSEIASAGFGSPLLENGNAERWDRARTFVAGERLIQPGGLQLDLSAIAKGAAVDELAMLAGEAGVASLLAEIGGEYVGRGVKPDGLPWWVDIESGADASAVWRIAACGVAVATSGDAFAARQAGENRISHVVPFGGGADPALRAVTVIDDNCATADAWATALFAAGRGGHAMADHQKLAALFLYDDGRADLSAAAEQMLQD